MIQSPFALHPEMSSVECDDESARAYDDGVRNNVFNIKVDIPVLTFCCGLHSIPSPPASHNNYTRVEVHNHEEATDASASRSGVESKYIVSIFFMRKDVTICDTERAWECYHLGSLLHRMERPFIVT
eukprot:g54019.t1